MSLRVEGEWRTESIGDRIVREFHAATGRPKCLTCAGRGDLGDVIPIGNEDPNLIWLSTSCPDCAGTGWAA
jgi:hypothetical protein